MFYAAIVDDEKNIADLLQTYLKRYIDEKNIEINVDWYSNPVNFLSAYTNRYDIVFLDIELPDINGMDVARKMREMDTTVALIFVTNMRQYAINGYEVNADDFIVKPVAYYDFAMKLDRVLTKLNMREVPKIMVNNDGKAKYIPINTIRYVEVFRHRLVYHTLEGNLESRGSLNKIEQLFLENNFGKCNNYSLVNLSFVKGIEGFTLLVGYGQNSRQMDELSISHPRKKDFVAALNKYLGVIV